MRTVTEYFKCFLSKVLEWRPDSDASSLLYSDPLKNGLRQLRIPLRHEIQTT
jgi:hypothetical protein